LKIILVLIKLNYVEEKVSLYKEQGTLNDKLQAELDKEWNEDNKEKMLEY
jgi:hypothetical protein